jgi:hypothetical protein
MTGHTGRSLPSIADVNVFRDLNITQANGEACVVCRVRYIDPDNRPVLSRSSLAGPGAPAATCELPGEVRQLPPMATGQHRVGPGNPYS